ncbi:MAG TPA: MraY family glycosyltransferase, partial [Candidatus Angelobacter sp.]|nr:MraY family glycosyltransferase [Candidatus Angelobacter sp.]
MRTISTAVLVGTSFFSDPTIWSDFSPSRFGPAILPFLVALVCTTIVVLPARWLAFKLGAVAEPGERRIHREPTARLGGLAMYLGFGLSAALFSTNPATLGLLLSAAVITTLMVFDDLRGVRPVFKLVFQVAASLLAIVGFGISIKFVGLPGHVVNLMPAVAIPLTLLWFVGLQNTINLIDGVDGLAAGVVAIVAATILLAAINRGESDIVILAGALIGACIGFLFFNWHPARVFMGDSGSNFLGFTLAALSVLSVAKGAIVVALVVPVAALAIPILDTAWAIVRRRLRG